MDPTRFRQVMDLVGEALEVPPPDREAWLEQRCDDSALRAEVGSLLARAAGTGLEGLTAELEAQVGRAAARVVDARVREVPERIGPYRIRHVLGVGGMGVVYAARQEEPLRRDVAVKVLQPGTHAPRVIERFAAERRTLAALDHPYIAHVFDAGTTEHGLPYLAMEAVEGLPIIPYCDLHRLDVAARIRLFLKVLAAVQYAHQKTVIHRDLKPSNILVTEVDGEPAPKVIDFGIARVDSPDHGLSTAHTAFGAVLGTIEYMSPEQALSPAEGVGTRADVYSLGVVLYELLTGVLPFGAEVLRRASPTELERLLGETEPLPPSRRVAADGENAVERARARASEPRRLSRALRGDLDNIIGVAMRKDAARRYASVAHFADDLERHLSEQPVSARPATWSYRTHRFVSRHRWGVGAGAAATVAALAAGVAFTTRLAIERDRARVEAEKAREVAGFLQEIFRVPDPTLPGAGDVTARQLLDEGAARISARLVGQPEVRASLLGVVGNTYRGLGIWNEAARRLEDALDLERGLYGSESLDVATRLHELGLTRADLGEMQAAETMLREALALRSRLLGEDAPETAATMTALAVSLRGQGRYAEAEEIGLRAVETYRRVVGPMHVETALALHNLAFIVRGQGRFAEAEALYREALSIRQTLLDPSHPDILQTMVNLALVVEALGDYEEAEALLREGLERRQERLGDDHPATLTTRNNLAYQLWRSGRYPSADSLFADAVAIGRRLFPDGHPSLAIMLNNLGVARRRSGDWETAEALHREAVAMNRRLLAEEHPRVAADLDNLGLVLSESGRGAEAEPVHRQAWEMRVRLLGEDHPDAAESLSGLARARLTLGDAEGAAELLRSVLSTRTSQLGESNPRRAAALHDLGVALGRTPALDEAEQVLRSALSVRRAALEAGHPDVAATLRELGVVLTRAGRYAEGEAALQESRRIVVARLGVADLETRRVDEALTALRRARDAAARR